jgi:hypothetical protein
VSTTTVTPNVNSANNTNSGNTNYTNREPVTHRFTQSSHYGATWTLAVLAGVVLIALARLIFFFVHYPDVAARDQLAVILGVFGVLVVGIVFPAIALYQQGLTSGARIALLIAGVFFLLSGTGFGLGLAPGL